MENNVGDFLKVVDKLDKLDVKLDRILAILEQPKLKSSPKNPKPPKQKALPLTQEEIVLLKAKFDSLYERWTSGDETEVQTQLESLKVDELRRFADANNLNVTSKMPKQKVLTLIATRFREKRQLLRITPGIQKDVEHNDA